MSRCVHWKPGPDLICFVAANVLMSYWYNSWWDMNFPHISVNCCHSSTQYFSKERNVLCVLKMGQISSSHTLWQKDIFTAFFIPAGKSEQTVTCEWPQVFNYEKKSFHSYVESKVVSVYNSDGYLHVFKTGRTSNSRPSFHGVLWREIPRKMHINSVIFEIFVIVC